MGSCPLHFAGAGRRPHAPLGLVFSIQRETHKDIMLHCRRKSTGRSAQRENIGETLVENLKVNLWKTILSRESTLTLQWKDKVFGSTPDPRHLLFFFVTRFLSHFGL